MVELIELLSTLSLLPFISPFHYLPIFLPLTPFPLSFPPPFPSSLYPSLPPSLPLFFFSSLPLFILPSPFPFLSLSFPSPFPSTLYPPYIFPSLSPNPFLYLPKYIIIVV